MRDKEAFEVKRFASTDSSMFAVAIIISNQSLRVWYKNQTLFSQIISKPHLPLPNLQEIKEFPIMLT